MSKLDVFLWLFVKFTVNFCEGKQRFLTKRGKQPGNEVDEIEPSKCVHLFVGHLLSYDIFFL